MKISVNDKYVQMLFALLRTSLHETVPELSYFEGATKEDWMQCYRLASAQGVLALAWDGVMKLPVALMPPLQVKISWATNVEAYEKNHARYCRVAAEVSRLYAEHGIKTMFLKGVGFSAFYPVPSHREGGDIDIYTFSADASRMSDKEANA